MTRIAESELILNHDQTIYHLKLAAEDLPDTLITVGDPARVARVSKHFDRVDKIVVNREIVTHIGELGGKRLAVISTGMGVGAIDIVFNELDALANIDLTTRTIKPVHEQRRLKIVRLGTAGGLQKDLEPGVCVVSTFGAGLDSLLHFYEVNFSAIEKQVSQALGQHLQAYLPQVYPYVVSGSQALIDLFPECVRGITLTCAGFYGPQGRQLRAKPLHPDLAKSVSEFSAGEHRITNFEMETAAIYGLGKILNHDCCSISTIVANRINQTYCKDGEAAVDGMIRYALEKIASLL
jgi:uridine phosphorylase